MNIFGQNYEEIGSKDKGLILKSSGKIKIQWGNKFIDLIDSNGNINSKILDTIKSITSSKEITSNGLYYLDNELIAKIGDNVFSIVSNGSGNFISFINSLDLESKEKQTALLNIGLIYLTKSDSNVYPENGFVYILDELKLYSVQDSTLYEYELGTLNQQVYINNPTNDIGALIIDGDGELNCILFDSLEIFSNKGDSVYRASENHSFYINDEKILKIDKDGISGKGFSIREVEGNSVLSVDLVESQEMLDILDTMLILNLNSGLTVNISDAEDGYRNLTVSGNSVWYIEHLDKDYQIRGIGNKTYKVECTASTGLLNPTVIVYDIFYKRLKELYYQQEVEEGVEPLNIQIPEFDDITYGNLIKNHYKEFVI